MQPEIGRPIPTLFNTGVESRGQPLSENQVDPHYTFSANPFLPTFAATYVATSAGGFPIPPWLPDNRSSAWISATTDTIMPGDAGTYTAYHTRFDLTGSDSGPLSAVIVGRWAADNRGGTILLNGRSAVVPAAADFQTWTYFDLRGVGFNPGRNTLEFRVQNDPDLSQPFPGPNPAGLRVEMWGMANPDCSGQTPRPQLTIQRSGEQFQLAWHGIGFFLQSAPVITGPWVDVTRGVIASGADFTATAPTSSTNRFFRLRQDCD